MEITFKRLGSFHAFFIDGVKSGKVEQLKNGKYKAYANFNVLGFGDATGTTKIEAVEKLIKKLIKTLKRIFY